MKNEKLRFGDDESINENIEEITDRLVNAVVRREKVGSRFSMLWVAGKEDELLRVTEYISEVLDINESDTMTLDIEEDTGDLEVYLIKAAEEIKKKEGERILLVAKGFEKIAKNIKDYIREGRAGHDWEQNVLRSSHLKKGYEKIDKHIIILTSIGFSQGKDIYEKAVKTALLSQFKIGLIET